MTGEQPASQASSGEHKKGGGWRTYVPSSSRKKRTENTKPTCAHQEQIDEKGLSACKLCGEVKQYDQEYPRNLPTIIQEGNVPQDNETAGKCSHKKKTLQITKKLGKELDQLGVVAFCEKYGIRTSGIGRIKKLWKLDKETEEKPASFPPVPVKTEEQKDSNFEYELTRVLTVCLKIGREEIVCSVYASDNLLEFHTSALMTLWGQFLERVPAMCEYLKVAALVAAGDGNLKDIHKAEVIGMSKAMEVGVTRHN